MTLRAAVADGIRCDQAYHWSTSGSVRFPRCRHAWSPAEVLTHPRTHPHMRVAELAIRLRCRDCRGRTARIDPVARLRTHACVAGMM